MEGRERAGGAGGGLVWGEGRGVSSSYQGGGEGREGEGQALAERSLCFPHAEVAAKGISVSPAGAQSVRAPVRVVKRAACPISTGRGTRRVRLVWGEGRGVSSSYQGGGGGAGARSVRAPVRVVKRRARARKDERSWYSSPSRLVLRRAKGWRGYEHEEQDEYEKQEEQEHQQEHARVPAARAEDAGRGAHGSCTRASAWVRRSLDTRSVKACACRRRQSLRLWAPSVPQVMGPAPRQSER